MFGIYFGKYLMDEGSITREQYVNLIEQTKSSKVQMGLLAVEMGLMTEDQADEINLMQQKEDKRFGDLAVEMEYLTEDDVSDLLDRQGDPYLLFIQALVEGGLMTLDEIREEQVIYRKAKGLSLLDLEDLKTGDVDRITPIFTKNAGIPGPLREYVMLTSRNIVRFVDRFFRMDRAEKIPQIEVPNMALQHIVEGYPFYTIFAGDETALSALAQAFARTAFDVYDEVNCTLDATKEFLNCNNGLFLTELSKSQKKINLDYPIVKDVPTIISADRMYRIPYYIMDQELDLILCLEDEFQYREK